MTQTEKHIWLIDTIRQAGRISLENISAKWQNCEELSGGKPLLRCKFNRWRTAILMEFGINIECEKGGSYRYYIDNPEAIDEKRLKGWIIDSFAVGNILSEYKSLSNRIVIDEIPSGRVFLAPLLSAMNENRVINLTYQRFGGNAHTFEVEPYCMRLYQNRWYLLGKGRNRLLWFYGLDRVKEVEITNNKFQIPKDFNAEEFFAQIFGAVLPNEKKSKKVVVRAYANHAHYFRSLPFHHSQQEIYTCNEYTDFEYYLAPTYDFIMALLGMGANVEIIKPSDLRDEFTGWVCNLAKMYMNSDINIQNNK